MSAPDHRSRTTRRVPHNHVIAEALAFNVAYHRLGLRSRGRSVAIAIVATVIVLVFILENLHATDATLFGVHWRIPLGPDLLLAALLGAIVVFVGGAATTLQLRLLTVTPCARGMHR